MIRKATIQDLNSIASLFNDYRIFYKKDPDLNGAKTFIESRFRQNDSEIYAAEENQQLVGFVQLYPLFSSTKMRKLWMLNDLYVMPEHRGKGLSKQLIDVAKELCKRTDACGLLLDTAKSNVVGNALYPRTGFVLDMDYNYYFWSNQ